MHSNAAIDRKPNPILQTLIILIVNFFLIGSLTGQSAVVSFEFDQLNCDLDSTITKVCDDLNACTFNDIEIILVSDGSICVPCSGQLVDCTTGPTTIVFCDDGNPWTINDQETLLNCDGSICLPCAGVLDSTVAVRNISDHQLSVYPNPIFEILNISLETSKRFTTKIFNQQGKLVLSDKNGNTQIDLSPLKSGVYWLEVTLLLERHVIRKSIIKL